MPIYRDGEQPLTVCGITQNGQEKAIKKIAFIGSEGEQLIWSSSQATAHRATFKSYEGDSALSALLWKEGATIAQPVAPPPAEIGEEAFSTFEGWAASPRQSSGQTGTLVMGNSDATYYAAFSGTARKYIVKGGAIQSGFGLGYHTTNGAATTGGFINGSVVWSTSGYHTLQMLNVDCTDYDTLVYSGSSSGWGIGNGTSPYVYNNGSPSTFIGLIRQGSGGSGTMNVSDITGIVTFFAYTTYTNPIGVTDLYLSRSL